MTWAILRKVLKGGVVILIVLDGTIWLGSLLLLIGGWLYDVQPLRHLAWLVFLLLGSGHALLEVWPLHWCLPCAERLMARGVRWCCRGPAPRDPGEHC